MILDNIRYIDTYRNLGTFFPIAIDYLKTQDLASLAPGRYPISGEDVYCIVQEQTNTRVPEIWEMHQQYVDIQYIIAGNEGIGVFPLHGLAAAPAFPEGSDNAVVPSLNGTCFDLEPGDYLILFPQDVHKPNCPGSSSAYSKKIIVKVRIK